jgi:hypothetical protein
LNPRVYTRLGEDERRRDERRRDERGTEGI